jgi:hypothetical protein
LELVSAITPAFASASDLTTQIDAYRAAHESAIVAQLDDLTRL